jgi:hypothetical protein
VPGKKGRLWWLSRIVHNWANNDKQQQTKTSRPNKQIIGPGNFFASPS